MLIQLCRKVGLSTLYTYEYLLYVPIWVYNIYEYLWMLDKTVKIIQIVYNCALSTS
jgi:hypothetical protein